MQKVVIALLAFSALSWAQPAGDKKLEEFPPADLFPPLFGFTGRTEPGSIPVVMWIAAGPHKEECQGKIVEVWRPTLFAEPFRKGDFVTKPDGTKIPFDEFLRAAEERTIRVLVLYRAERLAPQWSSRFRADVPVVVLRGRRDALPVGKKLLKDIPPDLATTEGNRMVRWKVSADTELRVASQYYALKKEELEVQTAEGKPVTLADVHAKAQRTHASAVFPPFEELNARWLEMLRPTAYVVEKYYDRKK